MWPTYSVGIGDGGGGGGRGGVRTTQDTHKKWLKMRALRYFPDLFYIHLTCNAKSWSGCIFWA